MGIEFFYNKTFSTRKRTETKVRGKVERNYATPVESIGAVFIPGVARTVRWGKQDFVIQVNLYCSALVDIIEGDRVDIDEKEYDVIYKENTNNQGHHLFIGLVSR